LPAVSAASSKPKANIAVSAPPHKGNLKSVEAKELDDDDEDDDDELSDLQSGDEDLPGAEDDDEELDSDLEGEDGDTTLDLTKLTRRQRAVYDEEQDESLMALSNEAQKKKHLTAEEHAMRRAEMARRRKNLSEKRNEEEKMDTINKLLKKPATKRRTRAEIIAAQNAAEATPAYTEDGEEYFHPASSLFVRYVNNKDGSRIGVPSEWLEEGQLVGQVLRNGWKAPPKMVEEVS
jgi:Ino eighty subunit 2